VPEAPRQTVRRDPRSSTHDETGHPFRAGNGHEVYAVWLYHVFSLSLRDAELILAERGITVSHETIRQWCLKFGADFARKLRRRRPKPGDTWHLDEVLILSANSTRQRQSCKSGHARLGPWHTVKPPHHA
jgi:putative transposase